MSRPPRPACLRRLLARWLPADELGAPGQERIVSSPLVVGLIALLAILVGMGFWLRAIIATTVAERTFNRGMQGFEDGDYRTSIRDFDAFIAANPEGCPRPAGAGDAVAGQRPAVRLAQRLDMDLGPGRRPVDVRGVRPGRAGPPEAFGDQRSELGDLVLRIGEGLADRRAGRRIPRRWPRPS